MSETEQNSWFEVRIEALADSSEAIEFALLEMDCLGTEINNLGVTATESVTVSGYFADEVSAEKINDNLNYALEIYGFTPDALKSVSTRTIGRTDWLYQWKLHWKPTELERFIVSPSWIEIKDSEKFVIYIEPNMAFGTGTHPTTRLCLNAIGRLYNGVGTFLDVGTGTGILAIGAAKIAALHGTSPKMFGCDTDLGSIKIADENADENHVGGRIEFEHGILKDDAPVYDFVCANLTIDVITPILPLLLEKSGKMLVLSGILAAQESEIRESLANFGITKPVVEQEGEWISVTIERS